MQNKNEEFDLKQTNKLPDPVLHTLRNINRNSPDPLYHQLLHSLYSVLEENILNPGSFFATEALLQKATNMSRSTIRKALEELTRKELLVRITGKGTFVALPEVQVTVPELKSLTQELTDRGMKPGSLFLNSSWAPVPENIKNELDSEEKLLCVQRIRTGNGIPLLYSRAYIPESLGITENIDMIDSLYNLLKENSKKPDNAIHTIKATIIDEEIANYLGVSPHSAGLFIERKTYDENGNFILYEEGVGRGDLYSYTLRMQHYSNF